MVEDPDSLAAHALLGQLLGGAAHPAPPESEPAPEDAPAPAPAEPWPAPAFPADTGVVDPAPLPPPDEPAPAPADVPYAAPVTADVTWPAPATADVPYATPVTADVTWPAPATPAPLPPAPPVPAPPVEEAPAAPAGHEVPAADEYCQACGARLSPSVDWCVRCFTPRPSGPSPDRVGAPASPAGAAPVPPAEDVPRPGVTRSAIWLAVGVIAFNIAVQATTFALERSARVQPDTAIAIGLWVGLAFYVVVAVFALRTRAATFLRTAWTVGDPKAALRNGLLVGAGVSVAVLGLQSLVLGHLVGDPTVQLVVSGNSAWRIVAAFVLFVGVGPVVEEYVFRGILAESLRGRGRKTAVFVSAGLFALAHLRPAGLVYYTLIGLFLGGLYFRHGLKASVAAHAIFNGLLVVAALVSVVGPAKTFTDDGAALHLPGTWKSVKPPAGQPYQFALQGPSAAEILVWDRPVPSGATFDPAALEAAAKSHELPLPAGDSVTSTATVTYPAGTAAVLGFDAKGYPGKVVVMVEHDREWVLVLSTAGSSKAITDFDDMLQHLTLP